MPSNCAMAHCSSRGPNKDLIFHAFPNNSDFKKKWVHACKRADIFNPKNTRVCSLHFQTEDYERDLKSELLGLNPKKKLKLDAIPTINLPISHSQATNCHSVSEKNRCDRMKRRREKEELEVILQDIQNTNNISINELSSQNNEKDSILMSQDSEITHLRKKVEKRQNIIDRLCNENEALKKELNHIIIVEKNAQEKVLLSYKKNFSPSQQKSVIAGVEETRNEKSPLRETNATSSQLSLMPIHCEYVCESVPEQNVIPQKSFSNFKQAKETFPTIAKAWGEKLVTLDPQQRALAEKAINDVLFEAGQGSLHRHSVKINENSSFFPAVPTKPTFTSTNTKSVSSITNSNVSLPEEQGIKVEVTDFFC